MLCCQLGFSLPAFECFNSFALFSLPKSFAQLNDI